MHEELRHPSGSRQPRHPREPSVDQADAFLADTRLLVVEDDPDSLAMLSIALEQCGAEVTAVDRSSKALDELKKARFDAVISDLGMPVIDGYDLMREIRGSLKLGPRELPAIALSGYASKGDRDRALASGFQMHLAKPFDVSFLPEMIRSLLTEKEK
jgi:CheY-like chemotaxis protein